MSAQIANGVPPESAPLSSEDQQFLQKLEQEFASDMPIQQDMLIRFVRGYANEKTRWETTVQKLKETLEWRKANNVDRILSGPLENEAKYFEMWPHDFHGFSKSGHPVYYESSCSSDPSKLLEAFTVEDQQKFHIQMMETLNFIKLKRERETGHRTYKAIVVMDLSGLSRQHMSSQFTGPIKAQINIDQYYYPESLQTLFIINAPFVFRMLWGMVKPWLHPLTAARIQILGSDYLKQLQEVIDLDQIPRYHGGSCSCCPTDKLLTDIAADKYLKFVQLRQQLLESVSNQPQP